MNMKQIGKLGKRLKKLFSENELNELGKKVRFSSRTREITPYRLVLAYIEALSCNNIQSIADIHRAFNALFDTNVKYKPFHKQLAKLKFGEFMRQVFELLLETLACNALKFSGKSPFSHFERVILQDGTSFGIHRELQDIYPGRFKKNGPAAVELHVTMNLLTESVEKVVLTPDTSAEAQFLPEPKSMLNALIMGDRGYFKKDYVYKVHLHGGCFLIKGKSSMNPVVDLVITESGKSIKSWQGCSLKSLRSKFRKTSTMDMDITWNMGKNEINCRLVVTWNPETNEFQYLVTNLPRTEYSVNDIIDAYRLRWQVELLFKEWKSYANLTAIKSTKESIVDGHIWASLCAATLQRFFAHITQKIAMAPISTRKVSMCLHHYLSDIFKAIAHRPRQLNHYLHNAIIFIANNAKRDSIKKDKKYGRAKLGLEFDYSIA